MDTEELTRKVIELDERTVRHTEQIKTCFTQIGEAKSVVDVVHKLATTVEILAREIKSMNTKIDKATNEIEEIKEKPGKRWDSLITVAITAIATAVITFFLTKLGLE